MTVSSPPDTADEMATMVALAEDPGAFLEWDENEVAQWIGAIGYAQYKDLIIGESKLQRQARRQVCTVSYDQIL
jgi:hypothetical protein